MFRALIIVVMAVAAAAFSCEECRAAGYNFRLAYELDGIVVECVPEDDASCTSEDRGVNVVRCHKDCAILEQMDARLSVEGKYLYLEGSCFVRARDECLDATTDCEVVPEMVSGEDGFGCVPRGFLAQAALRQLGPKPRGCFKQETCAQCLNQKENFCVFCGSNSAGTEGTCERVCHLLPGNFRFNQREKCPKIQCRQCTGSDNIWQVTYNEDGIEVKCVNEVSPGCRERNAVGEGRNSVRCYNHEQCRYLGMEDPKLLSEGFYPHPADSCFGRTCTECFDGTSDCEYWKEGTSRPGSYTSTFGCVPRGFFAPPYLELHRQQDCLGRPGPRQCYREESCAQCLNQEGCVYCGDAAVDGGACAEECPPTLPTFTSKDRDICRKLACHHCSGPDNIWRVIYKENGTDVKCVSEIDPPCRNGYHIANSTRCYNHERCKEVEAVDPQQLTEGFHAYPANSCFGKSCTECYAGPLECEYWKEELPTETLMGCAPKGFYRQTPTISRVEKCPT